MPDWPSQIVEGTAEGLRAGDIVLVLGKSGLGRSALTLGLASHLARGENAAFILEADPGQPRWGPPACVSLLAAGPDAALSLEDIACVATLDPARHQGAYLSALLSLLRRAPRDGITCLRAPGVVRGGYALEFTEFLLGALAPTRVVAIMGNTKKDLFSWHLRRRLGPILHTLQPMESGSARSRNQRRKLRTEALDRYLGAATPLALPVEQLGQRGRVPPKSAWAGRLIGLLDTSGVTVAMGEVVGWEDGGTKVTVRTPLRSAAPVDTLLFVNAGRNAAGELVTIREHGRRAPRTPTEAPLRVRAPAPIRLPVAWPKNGGQAPYRPRMLNSATRDPALLLRQRGTGRGLLFDIGWLEPLPARVLHAVGDLFISHAHMDHMQGLVTLLRVLLGTGGTVRLYGPPGLDLKVASLAHVFDFNLLGDSGPVLVVHVLDGGRLQVTRVQCSEPVAVERLPSIGAPDGLLVDEPGLRVRAVTLTHSVPVLAYRCETWGVGAIEHGAAPLSSPPRYSLAYVTDAADTPENRRRILRLAAGADILVCEARFAEAHRERAVRTGHLTARACGELARDADVGRVIPFHFSSRYEDGLSVIYDEVCAVCDRVLVPQGILDSIDPGSQPR